MFLRGTVYWIQDNENGKQETLRTKDRTEAERLLHAKNEAHRQPIIQARSRLCDSEKTLHQYSAVGRQRDRFFRIFERCVLAIERLNLSNAAGDSASTA